MTAANATNLLATPWAVAGQVGRGCQYPTPAARSAHDRQSPRPVDGQVGRGCQYPTPAARSAHDRQSPRTAKLNVRASGIAISAPAAPHAAGSSLSDAAPPSR
jgi:hypothetical protein